MAPDRGASIGKAPIYQTIAPESASEPRSSSMDPPEEGTGASEEPQELDEEREFLADQAASDTNFTVRGVLVGLGIGIIICFSNTYFGLQTGWVSGMAMPAALIGFAFFKSVARFIDYPFTPVENVLVQTVAGAVGTMPLGIGAVAVLPALNFLLGPSENGPLELGIGRLIIWSVGVCFFGVFVAVPLRKQVIIREKLRFPSGTATALMIGVLHGNDKKETEEGDPMQMIRSRSKDVTRPSRDSSEASSETHDEEETQLFEHDKHKSDWKAKIRLLIIAFGLSAFYTLVSYFIPQLHDIPILGTTLGYEWLWTLNPSPAYIGQGIIMGPQTTTHMLFGAILGWAILSPYAKSQGWAPGPVEDWSEGSKGWIVWVSLAIMLADSLVNIGWLVLRPLIQNGPQWAAGLRDAAHRGNLTSSLGSKGNYAPLATSSPALNHSRSASGHHIDSSDRRAKSSGDDLPEPDAPPEHLISNRVVYSGFLVSIIICVAAVHIAFPGIMPFWATVLAVVFSLFLSLMGVRALGETDLNPVSGISKLTQLVFALLVPSSPNATTINLLAGAISESAALQAGDMMQDLKTGHLLGAAPSAQFYGQLIGSLVGAVASALVYKLYTSVYDIPGGLFQVPTAYVWIFTARLITGKGLPDGAWQWALGCGCVWGAFTVVRIAARDRAWWVKFVPGGIAVAVGMYNVPSFTLARAAGGFATLWWRHWRGREEETVVVLASGLILGEGVVSIVNLLLASFRVPHL